VVGTRLVPVLAVVLLAGACSADQEPSRVDRKAEIYETITLWSLEESPPTLEGDPVVFLAPASGEAIAADVQAATVRELKDNPVVIRFADHRDEAILADVEGAPTRDDGLLVTVADVPLEGRAFDLDVELYRSEDQVEQYVLRMASSGRSWRVASSAERP
jgi:hypothetical protein